MYFYNIRHIKINRLNALYDSVLAGIRIYTPESQDSGSLSDLALRQDNLGNAVTLWKLRTSQTAGFSLFFLSLPLLTR